MATWVWQQKHDKLVVAKVHAETDQDAEHAIFKNLSRRWKMELVKLETDREE